MCVCVSVCVCVCMCIYDIVCICLCGCLYVYVRVYIHECVHARMHVHRKERSLIRERGEGATLYRHIGHKYLFGHLHRSRCRRCLFVYSAGNYVSFEGQKDLLTSN